MMTTIRISQSGEIILPDDGSNVICTFEPDDPRLEIKRYRIVGYSIRNPYLRSGEISISSVEEFLQIVRLTSFNVDQILSLLNFQRNYLELPMMIASHGESVIFFELCDVGDYSHRDILEYYSRYNIFDIMLVLSDTKISEEILTEETFVNKLQTHDITTANVDSLLEFQREHSELPFMLASNGKIVVLFEHRVGGKYSIEYVLNYDNFPDKIEPRVSEFQGVTVTFEFDPNDPLLKVRCYGLMTRIPLSTSGEDCYRIVLSEFHSLVKNRQVNTKNADALLKFQRRFLGLPNMISVHKQHVTYFELHPDGKYSHEEILEQSNFQSIPRYRRVEEFELVSKPCSYMSNNIAYFHHCMVTKNIYMENVYRLQEIQKWFIEQRFPSHWLFAANRKHVVMFEYSPEGDLSPEDILNYSNFPVESSLIQLQIEKQKISTELADCIREFWKKSGTIPSSEVGKPYIDRLDQLDQQIEQAIAADPALSVLRKRRKECLSKLCDRIRELQDSETICHTELKAYLDELTAIESELQVVSKQLSTPPEITFVSTAKLNELMHQQSKK